LESNLGIWWMCFKPTKETWKTVKMFYYYNLGQFNGHGWEIWFIIIEVLSSKLLAPHGFNTQREISFDPKMLFVLDTFIVGPILVWLCKDQHNMMTLLSDKYVICNS